ncbi:probable restriction/modification enzyme [Natronomonas pharaonis DSM 2160]|uniref:site-specific DNA-methyltransferase (adenine-specific) n=1 Tax=Natronomonas pharaonis (strain ATCC 35678 / DSM 2160 / CIP 103997 / JCM 8858 / NBRC 14720 / NCIMB 2260 / Gabara) TaxID=348780 RepID=A0A1U7EXU5_NATPD|nr:N-6 DNA methylase [Natronomonas pharaonis]CAI50028.1 probable restriction/modification enzyme [Natronomonas pharaonis DSM 2160]
MSIDTSSTDAEAESSSSTPRTGSTTFINTSGGLLTDELVSKLRQRHCGESAVRPETFALPNTEPPEEADIEAEIGDTWDMLRERWDELTMDETLFHMDVSDARTKWILKLFQNLGFEPVFQRENLEAGGIEANLSHKGWPDGEIESYGEMEGRTAPIIHTVEPEQKLDEKPEDAPRGAKSPHDTLQEFLNASDEHDWAVVTNGLTLRVLRDFYHTYTRGYVEFDLENMFTSRNYGDFRALYRLCHATRFIEPVVAEDEDDDVETPLEQLYQVALSTGVKVGQDLQSNVVSAIETLGTGLLNQEIREYLKEGGEKEAKEYYQEVLLLVYRLLFLMYAEQRGMMASRDSLYTDEYSITNLRDKAETRRSGSDRNTDLWHGLQSTFRLVEKGDDELGVPCYNGMLFDSDRLDWVSESECSNDDLLDTIEDLTLIEHEGTRQRISYADLGVEEIGSVYESLLEFTPKLATEVIELEDRTVSHGEFYLDDRGTERKETGSYYTDPGLVQELVQSSLKPVVEDRLEDATTTDEQEDALLDITVCDPASGSGAFLIAANNFLAQRLARIRSDSNYPPEDQIRRARRDVLQHCIYAVDLNPMAVELAKVSLWINSAVEDKPLNFLDHHIKCGNSLIGTNSELLEGEFPVDAYETSGGRDWHVGNEIRKQVRNENKERSKGSSESSLQQWGASKEEYVDIAEQLDEIEEEDTEDIKKKRQLYDELQQSEAYQQEKLAHDVWTAAFYWPMDGSTKEYPSPSTIEKIRRNSNPDDEALQELVTQTIEIAEQQRFFHWELEFPEIFSGHSSGFDCILGNPPWETFELKDKEFFAVEKPQIVEAGTPAKREKLIEQLEQTDPDLYERYEREKRSLESASKFIKESGRYIRTNSGKTSTHGPFAELALDNISPNGYSGIIVPTSLVMSSSSKDFFKELVEDNRLIKIFDFINTGIFPEIHREYKFSLLAISGSAIVSEQFEMGFHLDEIEGLRDDERIFEITPEEIELLNPNTKTCPTFRTRSDAELTLSIFENAGVFQNESRGENPWGVNLRTLFQRSGDSDLFSTSEELVDDGCHLERNRFVCNNGQTFLPLYEPKYIHQYDSTFATYEGVSGDHEDKNPKEFALERKDDPERYILPRYWVSEKEYTSKSGDGWHLAVRNITKSTNRRTVISTILPGVPADHNFYIFEDIDADNSLLLLAILNSYVLDFAARQKVDVYISAYTIKQFPIPSPNQFEEILFRGEPLKQTIRDISFKLMYNTHSLDSLAEDLGHQGNPYSHSAPAGVSREELRFKLEALMFYLYGLDEDQIDDIFGSFEQLKKEEKSDHGYYRTREKVKNKFLELQPDIEYKRGQI